MFRSALTSLTACVRPAADEAPAAPSQPSRAATTDPIGHAPRYVRSLAPYQVGKSAAEVARETGVPESSVIKLASNENPHGMSPKAREALAQSSGNLSHYPDDFALKAEIATAYGVSPAQVMLGNGSDEVITTVARAFLTPSTAAVMSQYAYMSYNHATMLAGAERITVPAKDYGNDLDAMLAAITPDTRVVWIAKPNNPTGTLAAPFELARFIKQVPRDVVVVLDEAYAEYLPEASRAPSEKWLSAHDNLVVCKTFSKIHGMAGLRLGFGLASESMIQLLSGVRHTYSCNSIGLTAARASLADTAFIDFCREENLKSLEQLTRGLTGLGLQVLPAHGNFVAFKVPGAPLVHQRLLKAGVIVRPLAQYDLPDFLRVSAGLPEHNQRFLDALRDALPRVSWPDQSRTGTARLNTVIPRQDTPAADRS